MTPAEALAQSAQWSPGWWIDAWWYSLSPSFQTGWLIVGVVLVLVWIFGSKIDPPSGGKA